MEKTWNNKRIRLLLTADPDTVEQFLADFGPVIYTWMYYQVGADAEIALHLTGQTFSQAVRELFAFTPSKQTLFQWLIKQARKSRDKGLEHRQMRPQRPWAWSQLPDEILCGLSQFRCELLDDKIISNSFVHEIIQAAMAELEPRDRELLVYRFCHLESEENIAEEMDCSVEEVQNWLYRSRHSFRRVFFEIIATANTGFAESSETGDLDIQDSNLEKMLSTTTIYQPLNDAQMDTLRQQLSDASKEAEKSLPKQTFKSPFLAVGIITSAIILLVAIIYWTGLDSNAEKVESPISTKDTAKESSPQDSTPTKKQPSAKDDIEGEELKRVVALGQAKDLDALLEILKSGEYVSQVTAAHFIGKLADPSAIELLEQAEAHWYPEPEDGNFFDAAIKDILLRYPEAIDTVAEDSEPEPSEPTDTKKDVPEPPAPIPNIAGIVSDMSNLPIESVELELTEKSLFSKIETKKKIIQVKTNQQGQYQLSSNYKGPASLTASIGTAEVKQSLWCAMDSICIVNMGGKPVLAGTGTMDGQPLSNQRLYLSDTLDINNAAFGQETLTDAEGSFSFLGISPGVYSVLYMGLDNRMHRLSTLDIPLQDVINVNLDISPVSFTVEYPAEPNTPIPQRAVLTYTMDAPEDYYQPQAVLEEEGTFFFEKILPGSYILKIQLDSGVWVQEPIEISEDSTLRAIALDPIEEELVSLSGSLLGSSPVDLFLTNANQRIHVDIRPNADGTYLLKSIPADIYSLAALVNGQLIEFTQIDLMENIEMTLDIDPDEMMNSLSPLYVVVTDPAGLIVSGAQVWLTNGQQVDTTTSTGQGAFLATVPGNYTLSAALPGYPTIERQVELKPSSLFAKPNPENTIRFQLDSENP